MKNKVNNFRKVLIVFIILCGNFDIFSNELINDSSRVTSELFDYPLFNDAEVKSKSSALTIINKEELERYSTNRLSEALTGLFPNLQVKNYSNQPGSNRVTLDARNLGVVVLVDGVERDIRNISVLEVDKIFVHRSPSGISNFGSKAGNVIILVKTLRGKENQKTTTRGFVEFGKRIVNNQFLPRWVDSYNYALLNNEARLNDGLTPKWDTNDLDGFRNHTDNLRYPNENLYSSMYNNSYDYLHTALNYSGGGEKIQYAVNLDYQKEGNGLYKVKSKVYDAMSIRTNLDIAVTSNFKVLVNIAGQIQVLNSPSADSTYWPVISTYPSLAYPIIIDDLMYGNSTAYPKNPFADLELLGMTQRLDRFVQSDIVSMWNMDRILKGLSLNFKMSNDVFYTTNIQEKPNFKYKLYEVKYDDNNNETLIATGDNKPDAGKEIVASSFYHMLSSSGSINYDKFSAKNNIHLGLAYNLRYENQKSLPTYRKIDFIGFARYSYINKFFADFTLNYAGMMNFPIEKKFKFLPAVGVAYIITEKEKGVINMLKLRANYGITGGLFGQNSTEYYLYRSEFGTGTGVAFGPAKNPTSYGGTKQLQIENTNLDWATQKTFNVGLDMNAFSRSLFVEVDYLRILRNGEIMVGTFPYVSGFSNMYDNIGASKYDFFELSIKYYTSVGNIKTQIGGNIGLKNSKILKTNEVEMPYIWMNRTGNCTDAIFGFESDDLFNNTDQINNSPVQTFGKVLPGNIRYKDLDGNNLIESYFDEKAIGHWSPTTILGLNINLSYKMFNLYVLGYGEFDMDINLRNYTYYNPASMSNYSAFVAENRWNPISPNSSALYPRLTTTTSTNDNRNSSYWLRDNSYFKIKNVEFSYQFNESSLFGSSVKLFVRATNLFTFSSVKELDPEYPGMGLIDIPSMRNFSGGLNFKF